MLPQLKLLTPCKVARTSRYRNLPYPSSPLRTAYVVLETLYNKQLIVTKVAATRTLLLLRTFVERMLVHMQNSEHAGNSLPTRERRLLRILDTLDRPGLARSLYNPSLRRRLQLPIVVLLRLIGVASSLPSTYCLASQPVVKSLSDIFMHFRPSNERATLASLQSRLRFSVILKHTAAARRT